MVSSAVVALSKLKQRDHAVRGGGEPVQVISVWISVEFPDPQAQCRDGRTEGGKISGTVKAGLQGSKARTAMLRADTYLDKSGVNGEVDSKGKLKLSGTVKDGLEISNSR